jgi:hypothetical protein
LLVVASGCDALAGPPLGAVQASAPSASPELRDRRNRLDIHYHLNQAAAVSSYIQSSDGTEWPIHSDAARPTAGDYVLQFDGTIDGPGPNERRVLPSGDYRIVLDVHAGSQNQEASVPLEIRDADSQPPDITDLTLTPDHISPDFDAQGDVTHVTFQVAKDARLSLYLDQQQDTGHVSRLWMGESTAAQAGEQSLTWDGLSNGQPVPTGSYSLGVHAVDSAGNVVERALPLVVDDSGVPEASIVSVQIGPQQIIRGDQVCLDTLVRNTGTTVLRTQGPDPSYVYNSFDNFASIENHQYAEHAGLWRVGLSTSGSTDINGATYPYRWGFGRDLQPGDEVPVHGCVQVLNEQDNLVYFAGLVQENVAIHNAGAGLVRVVISS